MRTTRIDGDVVVYRCGFAAEKGQWALIRQDGMEVYDYKKDLDARIEALGLGDGEYDIGFTRNPEPVENALHSVKLVIEEIQEVTEADKVKVYLSGKTNYRDKLATLAVYKGNRDEKHKPIHGPAIREYLFNWYDTVITDGEEADDAIGYEHYADWQQDSESSVISTIDKDLNMIPGMHYNFVSKELHYVDKDDADWYFWRQLLTGDTVDNVPGIPKIGPVRAAALLEKCETNQERHDVVRAKYEEVYGEKGEENMLEIGRLLWIRRKPHEMWSPSCLT